MTQLNGFTRFITLIFALMPAIFSCNQTMKQYKMGTYGYDLDFFDRHGVSYLELTSDDELARIVVVPGWQGRVMTSTSAGAEGRSYGWINYSFIESGRLDPQFNAFGGEERFWMGPEGGPFSVFFRQGDEQVFANWVVPTVIDTEGYDYEQTEPRSVKFTSQTELVNASGTLFNLGVERTVSLLSFAKVSVMLGVEIPGSLGLVAYESDNVLTNLGERSWTKEGGLLSIWILSMFNPSPETTVFIPYNTRREGVIVNDEYFGKVPPDRLKVDDGVVYFRADGAYRSKIGIPPGRATELCGSYDPGRGVLTLVWCTIPDEPGYYVNSNWGDQEDPYDGDVINSYNDGPLEDGSTMGPFYELESSSPALALGPGESAVHIQRVMHFEGSESDLSVLVRELFGLDIKVIESKF